MLIISDIESKSQEPSTKQQSKTDAGPVQEYCSHTADSLSDSKQISPVKDSNSKTIEKSSTDRDKKGDKSTFSDTAGEKLDKKEVKSICEKVDNDSVLSKGRSGSFLPYTPIKKLSKPESRFDPETLELIREIGSALLNSPAKSELEENETEDLKEGESLVSHYVKKIEKMSGVSKRKPQKEIIIIDKNDSTGDQKSQPGSPSGKTAMTRSASEDVNRVGTSKWSPVARKQTISQQDSKEKEEYTTFLNKSANPKGSPVLKNSPPGSGRSSSDITSTDEKTKVLDKSEESHVNKSDLTLDLKSSILSVKHSDEKETDRQESEVCSVKKLLGKFEMPEQASGKVTPVFGSPSILSPCSNTQFVQGVKSDTSNSCSRISPSACTSETSGSEVKAQGSFSRPPLLHRQSEPVIHLSEKSVMIFESKLSEMGTSLYERSPLKEESETDEYKVENGQGEGHGARPKSASYGPASGRKVNLRQSRTLPESQVEDAQGFTWEGKKVRKLYGKTHPLAKLEGRTYRDSTRNSPFYNTM